ncbi:MAG: restriction endonuclease [Nitrospirae bacterium]|nr:restriction endonuclease [Nitrospirota bacterium]
MNNIKITKKSGMLEDFNSRKLMESLLRSGAEQDQAEEILDRITAEITPYVSTKKIYRLAYKYLRQFNRMSCLKYSLKRGLSRLGPSGYPFEEYFGGLMRYYGYHVDVGIILEGKCVSHEVDVFAVSDREVLAVECKYRNNSDTAPPDVKTALYVQARFEDLRPVIKARYPGKAFSGWLVTNTRFTSDAIRYAECAGLRIRSWRYPENNSLEKMIEDKKLYPVTILSSLNSFQIRKLSKQQLVLMKDLAQADVRDIRRLLSISENRAAELIQQASELCF